MLQDVLVVEDSEEWQVIIKRALGSSTRLSVVGSATEAKNMLKTKDFQLIILDLLLPDAHGFEFYAYLQENERTQNIPIIFLTGNGDTASKITAFSMGAEDYVVKPFNLLEFRARVEVKLRKNEKQRENQESLIKGDLVIHVPFQAVLVRDPAGHEYKLDLTSKEFKLLYFLASHEGQIFSRDQIMLGVWGQNINILDRTIDTHICSLRKKMGHHSLYIQSVPSSGYRFQIMLKKTAIE